jgi:hypothetical protein
MCMAHNVLHLVEVEHQVQLTHIVEIVVQNLHKQVDALLQAKVTGGRVAFNCCLPSSSGQQEAGISSWPLTRYASSLSVTSMHMAKNSPAYRRYTTLFALNCGSRKAAFNGCSAAAHSRRFTTGMQVITQVITHSHSIERHHSNPPPRSW